MPASATAPSAPPPVAGGPRAALGAAPDAHRLVVDGVPLACDDHGAGPGTPVLCLHAVGHGASDFAALRARLAPGRRVLALDWPGHGRSGADAQPASAARYADLLDGVLDALGLARVVLVGNSIGGAVAIRCAAAHPERIAGLVLENPGGLAPVDDLAARAVVNGLARAFEAGARGAWWFRSFFAVYYRMVLRGAPAAAQRARIVDAAYDVAPALAQAWRSFARPEADVRALAPRVRCPTLFAWATQDQLIALHRSLPAVRNFPNARLERFRGGHAAHLEAPDAFADAVATFLARLDGPVAAT